MAAPTNTYLMSAVAGDSESFSDIIYDISPWETPFLSGVEAVDAINILHQWQTDALATAATNFFLEGSDEDADAQTATTVHSNTTSISRKQPLVSGTLDAVAKYGRRSELSYQIAKSAKELKRDMCTTLLANNTEVTGDSPRETGGIEGWIATNDNHNGTSPASDATARTDGTQRALTETMVRNANKLIADAGGMADKLMCGTFNRQKFSEFTGNSTRYIDAENQLLSTSVDLYKHEFGMLEVCTNLFMRARSMLILQMDMWAVAYLRPFQVVELAKVGDAREVLLLAEYALESRNEAASGGVFDLTVS